MESNNTGQRPVQGGRGAALVHGLFVTGPLRGVVQFSEQEPEWGKVEEQSPHQELDTIQKRFPSLAMGFLVEEDGLEFMEFQPVDDFSGESDFRTQDACDTQLTTELYIALVKLMFFWCL